VESIFSISFTDIIGYVASLTVLVSFLMGKITTLRLVNTAGASLFIWYGFLLDISIPIIFTNVAIVCINAFYLIKASRKK
jgi:hypothetical protein